MDLATLKNNPNASKLTTNARTWMLSGKLEGQSTAVNITFKTGTDYAAIEQELNSVGIKGFPSFGGSILIWGGTITDEQDLTDLINSALIDKVHISKTLSNIIDDFPPMDIEPKPMPVDDKETGDISEKVSATENNYMKWYIIYGIAAIVVGGIIYYKNK